jgi:hypothetical protein
MHYSQVAPNLRKSVHRQRKVDNQINFYHEGHEEHEEILIKQTLMVISCLRFPLRVLRVLRGSSFLILRFLPQGPKGPQKCKNIEGKTNHWSQVHNQKHIFANMKPLEDA